MVMQDLSYQEYQRPSTPNPRPQTLNPKPQTVITELQTYSPSEELKRLQQSDLIVEMLLALAAESSFKLNVFEPRSHRL